MQTTLSVVGIDVSKATLAVCHQPGSSPQHLEVRNTPAGFRELVRRCGARSLYVLEATGTCYLALAYHLVAAGAGVAVLNSIVVRRFIQMHLGKGKSDRKDADATRWPMPFPSIQQGRILVTRADGGETLLHFPTPADPSQRDKHYKEKDTHN